MKERRVCLKDLHDTQHKLQLAESCVAAGTLISHFPPDKWVYVPVGRSPSSIAAALEVMAGTDVIVCHLPITGADLKEPIFQSDLQLNSELARKKEVSQHVRACIPPKLCQGKNLVLIDFVLSGSSLYVAHSMVRNIVNQEADYECGQVCSVGIPYFTEDRKFDDCRLSERSPTSIRDRSVVIFNNDIVYLSEALFFGLFKSKAKYPMPCPVLSEDEAKIKKYHQVLTDIQKPDYQSPGYETLKKEISDFYHSDSLSSV